MWARVHLTRLRLRAWLLAETVRWHDRAADEARAAMLRHNAAAARFLPLAIAAQRDVERFLSAEPAPKAQKRLKS